MGVKNKREWKKWEGKPEVRQMKKNAQTFDSSEVRFCEWEMVPQSKVARPQEHRPS